MSLMTSRVEPRDRTENRVILEADRRFLAQRVVKPGTGLEFPFVLAGSESTLERRIQPQGDVSHLLAENGRDLVGPSILRETGTRVSDFLRKPRRDRKIPASRSDGGKTRAIPNVLQSCAIPRVRHRVEACFEPARETSTQLEARAERVVGRVSVSIVGELRSGRNV